MKISFYGDGKYTTTNFIQGEDNNEWEVFILLTPEFQKMIEDMQKKIDHLTKICNTTQGKI